MHIIRYSESYKDKWNEFIRHSKNGTFLLLREYMDYHQDRFTDHSLMIFAENNNDIVALLPANLHENTLLSHQGLTYGGLITNTDMTQLQMLKLFDLLLAYLKENNIEQLIYKTIPDIYHRCPADEDHYALFLHRAQLQRRDVLTVIANSHPIKFQSRRMRQYKKGQQHKLEVRCITDYAAYWKILEQNLKDKYAVAPVHTCDEITLLATRFPENIKLYACYADAELLAGIIVYETDVVAHFQYIAASPQGKDIGALDFLIATLLKEIYVNKAYIDFGISNEQDGKYLNAGLIDYKQGFGGRSVIHDHYVLRVDTNFL